jgi:hypothetical protein
VLGRCAYFDTPRARTADFAVIFTGLWLGAGPWIQAGMAGWQLPTLDKGLAIGAYMAIALYICGLFVGKLLIGNRQKNQNYWTYFSLARSVSSARVILLLFVTLGLRLFIGYKYGIFFSGDGTADLVESLPYYIVIAQAVAVFMETAAQVWAVSVLASDEKKRRKYVALVVLAIELAIAFIQGRRWLMELGVLFLLAAVLFNKRYRILSLRRKVMALGFVAICIGLFPVFVTLRQTYQGQGGSGNPIQRLAEAADDLSRQFSWQSALTENRTNMEERLDYIKPIATIEAAQKDTPYMYGWSTLYSFLYSLPRSVYPFKNTIPKILVSTHYGVMDFDWMNTWVSYGVADAGIAGAFLIGLMFSCLMGLSEIWLMRSFGGAKLIALAGAGNLFGLAFAVEADPSWFWNYLKIMVILFFVSKASSLWRGQSHKGRPTQASPPPKIRKISTNSVRETNTGL